MWKLVFAGAWRRGLAQGTLSEQYQRQALVLRAELFSFYKKHDAAHPEDTLTLLSDFHWRMLGTPDEPNLKLKGAEAWGFLLFLRATIAAYPGILGAQHSIWQEAVSLLVDIINVWKVSPTVVPRDVLQDTLVRVTFLPVGTGDAHVPPLPQKA